MISDALIASVKRHEGYCNKAYQDTVGVWTIGYGTNLQTLDHFPEEYAEYFLHRELVNAEFVLSKLVVWRTIDQTRKEVLIEMAYNMGYAGLMKFKKMWEHIHLSEYDLAADEMLDSRWSRQVGVRAVRLSRSMRLGYEAAQEDADGPFHTRG